MFKLFKKKKHGVVGNVLTFDKPISAYMKDMFTASGYSQRELADIMCVSHVNISRWISGERVPKVTDFLKFCNACGYDMVIIDKVL